MFISALNSGADCYMTDFEDSLTPTFDNLIKGQLNVKDAVNKKIRTEIWGYANDESLNIDELIKEKYQGIRPAPGYPACPNHDEKDKIWKILDVEKNIQISLTENKKYSS